MANIRKNGGRTELNELWARIAHLQSSAYTYPNIGDGGTNGRLRTNATITYAIGGRLYTKASTDDLWNLSGQTTLTGSQYQAFWLYLDSSGTASIGAGSTAATAAAALLALPTRSTTKSVIGVFVAGTSTNFANALAAQGTIYNGVPDATPVDVSLPVLVAP